MIVARTIVVLSFGRAETFDGFHIKLESSLIEG